MVKSNQTTVAARVQDVAGLLLEGSGFAAIRQHASENGWDVSERQIRRYIQTAHQSLAEMIHEDRGAILGRHLAQRRELYATAVALGDVKAALQVSQDEAKLLGLYAKSEVRLQVETETEPKPIDMAEVEALRQEMIKDEDYLDYLRAQASGHWPASIPSFQDTEA